MTALPSDTPQWMPAQPVAVPRPTTLRSSPDGQPYIGEKPDSQSASTWNKPGPLGSD
jgi:hypothetical protein